jgi:excisionase family DNA binding protein
MQDEEGSGAGGIIADGGLFVRFHPCGATEYMKRHCGPSTGSQDACPATIMSEERNCQQRSLREGAQATRDAVNGAIEQVGPQGKAVPPRLAYRVKETAQMLGISEKSVRRLIDRGLLRTSKALRHLLIPRHEIERFLRDTL